MTLAMRGGLHGLKLRLLQFCGHFGNWLDCCWYCVGSLVSARECNSTNSQRLWPGFEQFKGRVDHSLIVYPSMLSRGFVKVATRYSVHSHLGGLVDREVHDNVPSQHPKTENISCRTRNEPHPRATSTLKRPYITFWRVKYAFRKVFLITRSAVNSFHYCP